MNPNQTGTNRRFSGKAVSLYPVEEISSSVAIADYHCKFPAKSFGETKRSILMRNQETIRCWLGTGRVWGRYE